MTPQQPRAEIDANAPTLFEVCPVHCPPVLRDYLASAGLPLAALLSMHSLGEWGAVSLEEGVSNALAVIGGGQITSAWKVAGRVILITTGPIDALGNRTGTVVTCEEK